MARQREHLGARTGRFKIAAEASAITTLTIVRAGVGALRIFNSGGTAFTVTPGGGAPIPIGVKSSLDVKVTGDVVITQAIGPGIEGIYESIDNLSHPSRTGRFKGLPDIDVVVAQARDTEIYRFLNSGKHNFDVLVNGVSRATVRPRHSIDVGALDQQIVLDGGTHRIQGVYDYMDRRNLTRSGRFNIEKVLAPDGTTVLINPTTPHPIINLTTNVLTPVVVWYRIFNSGENPILLDENGTAISTVGPKQSFDFKVGATARVINVKSSNIELPIEGSYDFLK